MQLLIYKFAQNCAFNGGPDAALEGALDSGLNVAREGTPYSSTLKAIEDVKEGEKKGALDVSLDDALKYEHVSAAEGALDDSSEGTPTFEV